MATKKSKSSAGVQAAINKAGSISELARLIKVKRQAVQQWNQIPADRVKAVAAATGLSRKALRPDLFE